MNKLPARHNSSRAIRAKKIIFIITTTLSCLIISGAFSASAININVAAVDYKSFVEKAFAVLEGIVIMLGGGLGLWGVVNLIEAYGSDNPGSKSQGIKQFFGGIGIIVVGIVLVPVLKNLVLSAASSS